MVIMDSRELKPKMLIIFTNFDDSLLNQEENNYKLIIPIVEKLKNQGIPLITVTSKTRAEVEDLRSKLGLSDPFIVENGSAVFIPQDNRNWQTEAAILRSDYYVQTLGCSYIEARAGLKIIQSTLRINNLKGFGDFEDTEIQSLTRLSKEAARKAKTREFSEPFIAPKNISALELENAAAEFGFRIISGDRFSYVLGNNASITNAVQWLMDRYQPEIAGEKAESLVTIGLGNSFQDLEMLEKMDIPVVIANKMGRNSSLVDKNWKTTNSPGIQGWTEVITELCKL